MTALDKSLATEDKNMSLLKRDSWSFCRVALPEGHLKLENEKNFGTTSSFLKHKAKLFLEAIHHHFYLPEVEMANEYLAA